MASRRTRIKGIANIPQRRKHIENEEKKENDNLTKPEEVKEIMISQPITEAIKKPSEDDELKSVPPETELKKEIVDQPVVEQVCNPDDTSASNHLKNGETSKPNNVVIPRRTRIKAVANIPQRRKNVGEEKNLNEHNGSIKAIDFSPENTEDNVLTNDPKTKEDSNGCAISQDDIILNDPSFLKGPQNAIDVLENLILNQDIHSERDVSDEAKGKRRTFVKPQVSSSAFNRKPKQIVENDQLETDVNMSITIDVETSENTDLKEKQPISKSMSNSGQEVTLDEVHLTPQADQEELLGGGDNSVKKIPPQTNNNPTSDTEYPPPPPSPSKINRSRIKAIPRLGYRKTSFSASESEDESKRNYNRNRNDSVCSTASGVPESISDCLSPQRPKDFTSTVSKKFNRTDQSRKLTEARKEFQRRFGNSKPDRQRLTMIDLIYYNPTSNPMTNDVKPQPEGESVQEVETNAESETVDDPQQEKNEVPGKSDEENEMPVPQIKIGPSGEIILDEKSLVIESKEVIKQREELQKKKLVNGDFDTGYGIYKRHKRAKDWTRQETLRFYRALSTIGTDFTLMCELFPRRDRRELKLKFKKEERINRALVDKVVTQPCKFDYAELKHEVDMEEKELRELQKQKEEEQRAKQERMEQRKRKAMETAAARNTENSAPNEPKATPHPKPPKIRKIRQRKPKKFNIESVLDDSDADVSDIATQSESEDEDEVVPVIKATRSGRIPKITRKFDVAEESTVEEIIRKNRVSDTNPDKIQPGSIMIITEVGPNGEPIHKIYMVTEDNNATPLKLDSDVVSKAIQLKKGVTAQNILTISATPTDDEEEKVEEVPEENNVTIPADESVTTLRGDGGASREGFEGASGKGSVSVAIEGMENS